MTERNDHVRAMITTEWRPLPEIVTECMEQGLYDNRQQASSMIGKMLRAGLKWGEYEMKRELHQDVHMTSFWRLAV